MSIVKSVSFDEICQRGCIRDTDVKQLRALYYGDGRIAHKEAECLFEINDACRVQDPSWSIFFVEAISDYLVNDAEPEGYLTKANADWLMERVSHDGIVESQTELELLLGVLDKARWSPESLITFTLEQVMHAVTGARGPLRIAGDVTPGTVTDGDVEILRRALYAFAGDGNIAITRREAEVLFAINDATAGAHNSSAWDELFVKAIANCIMAASGYSVPTRMQALQRDQWLEARGELSLGNIISSAFSGGLSGIIGAYQEQSCEERALARLEQQRLEIITNQEITGGEADWLAERIGRDGELTPNEVLLLKCIKESSPKIDARLTPLLDKVEIAA
jgi:hypothetical protein